MARIPPGPPDIRFTGKSRTRPVPDDRGYFETYAGVAAGVLVAVFATPLVVGGLEMMAGGEESQGIAVEFLALLLYPLLAVAAAPVGVAVRLYRRGYTGVWRTVVAMAVLLGAVAVATRHVGIVALIGLPGIPAAARAIGTTVNGDLR